MVHLYIYVLYIYIYIYAIMTPQDPVPISKAPPCYTPKKRSTGVPGGPPSKVADHPGQASSFNPFFFFCRGGGGGLWGVFFLFVFFEGWGFEV